MTKDHHLVEVMDNISARSEKTSFRDYLEYLKFQSKRFSIAPFQVTSNGTCWKAEQA